MNFLHISKKKKKKNKKKKTKKKQKKKKSKIESLLELNPKVLSEKKEKPEQFL